MAARKRAARRGAAMARWQPITDTERRQALESALTRQMPLQVGFVDRQGRTIVALGGRNRVYLDDAPSVPRTRDDFVLDLETAVNVTVLRARAAALFGAIDSVTEPAGDALRIEAAGGVWAFGWGQPIPLAAKAAHAVAMAEFWPPV